MCNGNPFPTYMKLTLQWTSLACSSGVSQSSGQMIKCWDLQFKGKLQSTFFFCEKTPHLNNRTQNSLVHNNA